MKGNQSVKVVSAVKRGDQESNFKLVARYFNIFKYLCEGSRKEGEAKRSVILSEWYLRRCEEVGSTVVRRICHIGRESWEGRFS